jgi:hypothetical protein
LVMTVASHVHREYEHVRPWRKSLGGVSPSTLVGSVELFDPPGSAPETYHRRSAKVLIVNGPQYYYVRLESNPTTPTPCELHCLYYFRRRYRGMELPDIVKAFSPLI